MTRSDGGSRPGRLVVLLTAVAVVIFLSVYWFGSIQDLEFEEGDLIPAGRWHLSGPKPEAAEVPDGEEIARTLSLPYLSGSTPASEHLGVTAHDPDAAWAGVNLYVSGHGPEALLIDMEGRPLHRWRYPFERAFPGKAPTIETAYWRRAHLLPDGDLLALFQGGGLIRLDRESRLLWAADMGLYNDFFVAPDNTILAILKEARIVPEINPDALVLEDSVVKLDPDGAELDRLSLLEAFDGTAWKRLLDPLGNEGDIFHSNTIEMLDERAEDAPAPLAAGLLLVSIREIDIVALVDPGSKKVVWAARGPWRAQHQPTLLDDGALLLFDNKGADGSSRVLEFEPPRSFVRWQYRGEPQRPLISAEAGSSQRLPNGNTLITESERGRALEIDPAGRLVWEYTSPHRAGRNESLVATLFEVVRLPLSAAGFADRIDDR